MSNFWQRAWTGLVFVAVIVGLTLYNKFSFLALLLIIGVVGVWEYFRIVFSRRLKAIHYLYMLISAAIIALPLTDIRFLLFLPLLFACTAFYVLISKERSWHTVGNLFVSIFYIPVPLMMFYHSTYGIEAGWFDSAGIWGDSEFGEPSPSLKALNLFILIWSSDTFAYLSGRAFGKRKLFESVSPKKTWEGFIGGAVLTLTFSIALSYFFHIPLSVNLALAFLTVVFGTLGDLVESMLKRQYGIKDSGNILPGHGGVLDRFDALLISLPFTTVLYYFL